MSSSIGNLFKLTTFGESHGISMGGIIDGCPSGKSIDIDLCRFHIACHQIIWPWKFNN